MPRLFGSRRARAERRTANRRRAVAFGAAAVAVETATIWLRAHRLAGNVVVRCRSGHLFTSIWIPAASVKAVRLGPWRLQYCPVGRHWTLVTPVDESALDEDVRDAARAHHDVRLP